MIFLFSFILMEWDKVSILMLDPDLFDQYNLDEHAKEMLYMHNPVLTEVERIQEILSAKYCKKCRTEYFNGAPSSQRGP